MENVKYCPFAFAFTLDYSCEYEKCQWWDYNNNCCCVLTICKALEAISIAKQEAKKQETHI